MTEVKRISIKKRKVSTLNELEMGNLMGKGDTDGYVCNTIPKTCITDDYFICFGGDDTTGYFCISSNLTMPCETYPKCK